MPANPFVGPILVVEDEPDIREAYVALLEAEGYRVLEANDGAQALPIARAERARLGLVLLDWRMPGLHGDEVLERLGPDFLVEVPVVLITAGRARLPPVHGVRAVLSKPFELPTLLALVAEYGRRIVVDGG